MPSSFGKLLSEKLYRAWSRTLFGRAPGAAAAESPRQIAQAGLFTAARRKPLPVALVPDKSGVVRDDRDLHKGEKPQF
ncbi:MAG TPA: hypothetical protein VG675_18905 [Bryobacteraceae bacterium]|nr:hypothetical protein [Bryobacteraceae bacterium]